MVYFIGAGPGAVDLISVRGAKLLREANVIIYAGSLVNPDIISEYVSKDVLVYNSASMSLEDVIKVMIENKDKIIIRLHTGDPSLYGAHKEQMDILKKEKINYEVVPGISSMFGAAAALECEFTLPNVSQTLIISRVSGRTLVPKKESITSLSSHQASLVLFLSMSLLENLKEDLVAGGYDPLTPAAIIYKATWPDQKIYRTNISELKEVAYKNKITKTALIFIGDFLDSEYEFSKLYDKTFTHEYRKGLNNED